MKVLIVESSPLPILIPLGPKYSPQDPVFKIILILIIIITIMLNSAQVDTIQQGGKDLKLR